MNAQLHKFLNEMEHNKSKMLGLLDNLNEEELHWKKATNIWSVAQVLDHVIYSEQSALQYCHKKLLAGDKIPNASLWNSGKIRVYFWALETKLKFKAPKPISNPGNEYSLTELVARWHQTRTDYISFLNEYPDKYLNKAVFRHPLAGRIKLSEMLRFLNVHIVHHQYQINRILRLISGRNV